ncbi:FimV/HubP family polar landmark protein [Bacterioplanoides sp.]|uniref:FimV/HubP family polar landmark protein n=1 Tax=Bacterioplanoides sp. TaxID=2066072 RepID=UPI003AFF96F8
MKRLIAKSLMLAGGLSLSSNLMALGLGEMTLNSALNQPLQAEIELVDVKDLSKWEIKPSLASVADFERAGVDRVFFLTKIKFDVTDGKITLTSREAVTEPFLNFLVELNWPSGRVLREYTVLLDPPVFEEETINPLVVAPAATAVTSSAQVSADSNSAAAGSRSGNDWLDTPAAPGTYKVQQNDTLWEIALQTRPSRGVSAQQMMLAIQQQNPNAFIGGNINRLKTHQVLRIPSAADIEQIRTGQAIAEVERQNQALATGGAQLDATGRNNTATAQPTSETGGEVRLLSATQDNAESAGASGDVEGGQGNGRQQAIENDLAIALETLDKSRLENQELRQRLESLEEQIATLQRLITLKDDQLASIQVSESLESAEQAAEAISEGTPAGSTAETSTAETNTAETTATVAPGAEQTAESGNDSLVEGVDTSAEESNAASEVDFNYQETPADDTAQADAEKEKAEAEARRQRIAAMLAEQNQPKPTLIDTILQRPEFLLGGLAFLLALLLGAFKLIQKRKAAKEEEAAQAEESAVAFTDGAVDGGSLDDLDFDDDLATTQLDINSDPSATEAHDDLDLGEFDTEQNEDFGSVAQTEDVISESDIYVAYGKFEQAVDLLTAAIEQEPSRSDLQLKLLEVYVEMDDAAAFAKQESQLMTLGDDDATQQAEQMRSRLSMPVSPVAAEENTGLSLDDDLTTLDDSLGEEFSEGLDFGDALDLGDDLSQGDELEGAADSEASLDVSLDMPAADQETSDALEFDLSGMDSADELAALDEEATLEDVPTLDLGETLEFDISSESEELNLDDLSDDAELSGDAVSSVDETEAATDDSLDFDLSSLNEDLPESDDDFTSLESLNEDSDDTLEFDLGSLESGADDEALDLTETLSEDDASADDTFDLSADLNVETDSGDDLTALEDLMDSDDDNDAAELPDLSFDMDTGFSESGDDDLKTLEAELDAVVDDSVEAQAEAPVAPAEDDLPELTSLDEVDDLMADDADTSAQVDADVEVDVSTADLESGADVEAEGGVDFAAELAELDAELEEFEAPVLGDDDEQAAEPDSLESSVADADIPVIDDVETEAVDSTESQTEEQDIDLEQLAAADDEFDFLAGTDECATKLDLARAYIDMEDADGARELLQEVLQEGSDQQKQDARDLMDKMS